MQSEIYERGHLVKTQKKR